MKKALITLTIIALGIMTAAAQTPVLSNNNYWVIESNIHGPKSSTIRFYNYDQKVIYEETLPKKINVNRSKTRKILNEVLRRLAIEQSAAANKNLCALLFKIG